MANDANVKKLLLFHHDPAATDTAHNGYNSGRNSGRYCWKIAGTLCGGEVQGAFAAKALSCLKCDFYLTVKDEEVGRFIL